MPTLPKPDPRKYCRSCGARLRRKRYNGRLEDLGVFKRRQYCDLQCSANDHQSTSVSRSGHLWRARRHLLPACERCGSVEKLHVHHRDNDWRNDDPANLETLCATCHLAHHWETDGRRERTSTTRRVPLAAVQELEGLLEMLEEEGSPVADQLREVVVMFR